MKNYCEREPGHWYYLHKNGALIHKRTEPDADSDFVRRVWSCDPSHRGNAWRIILEALDLGASHHRVKELATRWGLTKLDLAQFLSRQKENAAHARGLGKFCPLMFGQTFYQYLDELADPDSALCKELAVEENEEVVA